MQKPTRSPREECILGIEAIISLASFVVGFALLFLATVRLLGALLG